AEILDQHIGTRDQLPGKGKPLGRLHVELQAFLVAVERRKKPRPRTRQPPCVVALAYRLDLDDVGAEITKHETAAWTHHHVGELNNTHASERKRRGHQRALPAAAGVKPLGRPAAGTWP